LARDGDGDPFRRALRIVGVHGLRRGSGELGGVLTCA
jgi:hypothetical protein